MRERLQDKRIWMAGAGLVALLMLLIAWTTAIHPQLTSAKAHRADAASTSDQATAAQARLNTLKRKSEHLADYRTKLKGALSGLPADTALPEFTRQVSRQAAARQVKVTSISIGAAAPYTAPVTGAAAPAASGQPASATMFTIPVTLQTTGSLTAQELLIQDLRLTGPRLALVTGTQFSSSSGASGTGANASTAGVNAPGIGRSTTATVSLQIFYAPRSVADQKQLAQLLSGS